MKLNSNLNVNDPQQNAIWELGQEGGRTRLINKDILFQNMKEVFEVFKKYEIKCWISHGTMLGIYRDKDFISYDDDADIGADITTSQNRLQAEEELRLKGFYVPLQGDPNKPIDSKNNMPYSDTVAIRNGEKVEVWWFTKKGSRYVYDEFRQPPELVHDAKYYDVLGEIEFRGIKFPIPNHIEKWIVMMYGQDWNVPQEGVKYNNARGRER